MPQDNLNQIDKPRLATALMDACHAAGTVDMRRRTPAEIAEQLQRDATSLEMTGASFDKDQQFYQHVAANVREAAAFLAVWERRLDELKREQQLAKINLARRIWKSAAHIGTELRDMASQNPHWFAACTAMVGALVARHDSCSDEAQS